MSDQGKSREFLAQFHPNVHGAVANQFYDVLRSHLKGLPARELCSILLRRVDSLGNVDPPGDGVKAVNYKGFARVMRARPDLAIAQMEWTIHCENLPKEERAQQKTQTEEERKRQWMSGQPPTLKQKNFLVAEEPGEPPPKSRLEASERIQAIIDRRGQNASTR